MRSLKFRYLLKTKGSYKVNDKVYFKKSEDQYLDKKILRTAFDFAYKMASNDLHRSNRTQGMKYRKPNEVFVNTLIGKLGEFVAKQELNKYDINVQEIDLELYERGRWDNEDLLIVIEGSEYSLNIKTTKVFGNLLLLEEGDYNKDGIYLENSDNKVEDGYLLVRINLPIEEKLKRKKKLYNRQILDEEKLVYLVAESIDDVNGNQREIKVYYDIPGFISHEDVKYIIDNNYLIEQGDMIGTKTKMDANNYYIQAGSMRALEGLAEYYIKEYKK